MKTIGFVLLCMLIFGIATGQETRKTVGEVQVSPPKFMGIVQVNKILNGERTDLISEYLSQNVVCPKEAVKYNREGTEVIRFTVTAEGNLTGFEVLNSVSKEVDKEVIRVLKTTDGMWKPGVNNNEPVPMEKEISMRFVIGEDMQYILNRDFTRIARNAFIKANDRFLTRHKPRRALKRYDLGVRYLPNDVNLLFMRGLCRYELGDEKGAYADWNRVKELGGTEINAFYAFESINNLKGFDELMSIIDQKK